MDAGQYCLKRHSFMFIDQIVMARIWYLLIAPYDLSTFDHWRSSFGTGGFWAKLSHDMKRNHAASCTISVADQLLTVDSDGPKSTVFVMAGFVWSRLPQHPMVDSHILHQSSYLGVYPIVRHSHIILASAKMIGLVDSGGKPPPFGGEHVKQSLLHVRSMNRNI